MKKLQKGELIIIFLYPITKIYEINFENLDYHYFIKNK